MKQHLDKNRELVALTGSCVCRGVMHMAPEERIKFDDDDDVDDDGGDGDGWFFFLKSCFIDQV